MRKKIAVGKECAQMESDQAALRDCSLACSVSRKNIAFATQASWEISAHLHCSICCNLLQVVGCMYCVWEFATDAVMYSPNWDNRLGRFGERGGVRLALQESAVRQSILGRVLKAAGQAHVGASRCRLRQADGSVVWYRTALDLVWKAGEQVGAVVAFTDITRERETLRRLYCRTQRDSLTGLYNKRATQRLIEAALPEGPGALLFIDIDNFKWINDQCGHLAGDSVLRQIGAALRREVAARDIAGRIGGDEFMLYLRGVAQAEALKGQAEALLRVLKRDCLANAAPYPITLSVGAVLCRVEELDFLTLYGRADRALYSAKHRGKNCFVLGEAEE